MKNPFAKPKPQNTSALPMIPIVRSPELEARSERMGRIIRAAAERALQQSPRKVRKLLKLSASKELQMQCLAIDMLSNDDLDKFLTALESGVPEDLKHMLQ